MIIGRFAISLDLILGYAGIVSLGHAAFFGLGAYTAGILSAKGWGEPLTGTRQHGQPALGRRAADARDRARIDGQPEAAAAR
jgi:branched-chain amino acid transport system permease protein